MEYNIVLPKEAVYIIDLLKNAGFTAYAVGGCVRDSIMGKLPSDWDIATSASPKQMIEIFSENGMGTVLTGLKHGTVSAITDGKVFECTTYRTESGYSDSRHPDSVSFTRNIEEDLCRRDFTVNAMAYAPGGNLVDLFGGMTDLKGRVIRAVGNPEVRFSEDALRILRAVRFACTLGFEIERNTLSAAFKCREGLSKISPERKTEELKKILISKNPDCGIELVFSLKLEEYILPGLYKPGFSLNNSPDMFEVRLALLVSESPNVDLKNLRLSNKQFNNTILLRDKPFLELSGQNARFILKKYGSLSGAVCQMYGYFELGKLVNQEKEKNPCVSLSSLAVNGNDLKSLGINSRFVGTVLNRLLDAVILDPSLNSKDGLNMLAMNIYTEILNKNSSI